MITPDTPQDKRVYAAGTDWCADVLDVFVSVDESVAVGDVVSRSYTPATKGQATVVLHLYATTDTRSMVSTLMGEYTHWVNIRMG